MQLECVDDISVMTIFTTIGSDSIEMKRFTCEKKIPLINFLLDKLML